MIVRVLALPRSATRHVRAHGTTRLGSGNDAARFPKKGPGRVIFRAVSDLCLSVVNDAALPCFEGMAVQDNWLILLFPYSFIRDS